MNCLSRTVLTWITVFALFEATRSTTLGTNERLRTVFLPSPVVQFLSIHVVGDVVIVRRFVTMVGVSTLRTTSIN